LKTNYLVQRVAQYKGECGAYRDRQTVEMAVFVLTPWRGLCSLPRMNRVFFCVALIVAFTCVQGISLHGHKAHAHDEQLAMTDHDTIRLHSHAVGHDVENTHEHSDVVEIDLFGTAIARDVANSTVAFALTSLWALVLVVLWVCIRRSPPPVPLVHFGPPHVLRPSPRAPPF
jgi:hypothetical protein